MNTEKKLYQWDTGQKLTGCTGLYVDFPIDNEVYRVETVDGMCIIPDELLQTSGGHKVYECMTNNTIRSFAFSVTPRPKPPDYVFTPTERLTFEGLVQKVDDAVADMIRRADSGEFDGHTPVKGTDYFTTAEIQQIQNEVSSGAIGDFKSVVDTETETFNNNAETKLNAYNQNDSQKTNAYNTNATQKLNAYNTNANNRVAEFDAHTEQIQTDIGGLKSDLAENYVSNKKWVQYPYKNKESRFYYNSYAGTISASDVTTYDAYTFDVTGIYELIVSFEGVSRTDERGFVLFGKGTNGYTFVDELFPCNVVTSYTDEKVNVPSDATTMFLMVKKDGTYSVRTKQAVEFAEKPYVDEINMKVNKADIVSENIYDSCTFEDGWCDNNGNFYAEGIAVNYKRTDYISVNSGDVINTSRLRFATLFNSNKDRIDGYSYPTEADMTHSITVGSNGYIILTIYKSDYENNVIKAYKNANYFVEDAEKEIIRLAENADLKDLLSGKKWVVCGDSFTEWTTETFSDGEFAGKYKTYPYLIAERTGINIEQFFASGRTMAYPSDGTFANSLTNPNASYYYQNIPSDVDYITIYLGINDLNHASGSGTTPDGEDATGVITLGTINDTDTSTYYGAYNTVLSWLRENRPFAHVGIIVTNGTENEEWTNAQIELAKKYGYPYINLNGDERTPAMIRTSNPNISDSIKDKLKQIQGAEYPSNTHPNAKTHGYESVFIEAWLRTL